MNLTFVVMGCKEVQFLVCGKLLEDYLERSPDNMGKGGWKVQPIDFRPQITILKLTRLLRGEYLSPP